MCVEARVQREVVVVGRSCGTPAAEGCPLPMASPTPLVLDNWFWVRYTRCGNYTDDEVRSQYMIRPITLDYVAILHYMTRPTTLVYDEITVYDPTYNSSL